MEIKGGSTLNGTSKILMNHSSTWNSPKKTIIKYLGHLFNELKKMFQELPKHLPGIIHRPQPQQTSRSASYFQLGIFLDVFQSINVAKNPQSNS
jgi:hypothetical protein